MVVENGWVSPYMVRDTERMETVFEDPLILMTNKPISHPSDLLPALDQLMKEPRPLVILAEKVDGGALGMLVANNQHRTLEAVDRFCDLGRDARGRFGLVIAPERAAR